MKARIRHVTTERIDIRAIREAKGKKLEEVADALNIDKGNYSRMERGILAMSVDKYNQFIELMR